MQTCSLVLPLPCLGEELSICMLSVGRSLQQQSKLFTIQSFLASWVYSSFHLNTTVRRPNWWCWTFVIHFHNAILFSRLVPSAWNAFPHLTNSQSFFRPLLNVLSSILPRHSQADLRVPSLRPLHFNIYLPLVCLTCLWYYKHPHDCKFLERGAGRKKERERNWCNREILTQERNTDGLPLTAQPVWGPNTQPRHVPWLGIKLVTPRFAV